MLRERHAPPASAWPIWTHTKNLTSRAGGHLASPSRLGSLLPLGPAPGKRFLEPLHALPPATGPASSPRLVAGTSASTPGPDPQQGGIPWLWSSLGEKSDHLWDPGGQESSPMWTCVSAGTPPRLGCGRGPTPPSRWGSGPPDMSRAQQHACVQDRPASGRHRSHRRGEGGGRSACQAHGQAPPSSFAAASICAANLGHQMGPSRDWARALFQDPQS